MQNNARLLSLIDLLRGGNVLRARDLAARLNVTERTIYRDMDRLMAAGVPVLGTRGKGYHLSDTITLPPLTLTPAELEALHLGLAIAMQVADPDLQQAATGLAHRIDTALPLKGISDSEAWKTMFSPFSDMTRGLAHLPTLRAAIRARQKIDLSHTDFNGALLRDVVHPLALTSMGRVWILEVWSEGAKAHQSHRLDLVHSAEALPELFSDPPAPDPA